MASKLSSLRVDLKRENEGDWIDIPGTEIRLKVRGFNYGPYKAAKTQVDLKNQQQYFNKKKDLPDEKLFKINGQLYLDYILLDWDGVAEDDGSLIPFSRAEEYILDPAFRILHEYIRFAGGEIGEINVEQIEVTSKNFEPSSAGNSMPESQSPTG
jgi:hypothetical protein